MEPADAFPDNEPRYWDQRHPNVYYYQGQRPDEIIDHTFASQSLNV